MEWTVPVNEMLHDDITKITNTLLPPGFHGPIQTARLVQESLSKLIDRLGELSSTAQGLNKVITTAQKLRNANNHSLYLLKDSSAKEGKGDLVGLLKVGRKHLFLFDERGQVRELEPMCVLDFFVRADLQRHGLGRKLFEHMLNEEGVRVEQLAIDGPSPKMEQFLRKNYHVEYLLRQNNNFAVCPDFFGPGNDTSKSSRPPVVVSPSVISPSVVGRFAAHKPNCSVGSIIHGGDESTLYNSGTRGKRAMNWH